MIRADDDTLTHCRFNSQPNTPMIRCEPYRCLISEKECRARKDRAKKAKRVIVHHYQRCTMASDEWQRLSKCAKCRRTP